MGLCLAASTFAAYLIRALVVDPEAASEADDEHDEDGVYCPAAEIANKVCHCAAYAPEAQRRRCAGVL
jgi:hypothetical protein